MFANLKATFNDAEVRQAVVNLAVMTAAVAAVSIVAGVTAKVIDRATDSALDKIFKTDETPVIDVVEGTVTTA